MKWHNHFMALAETVASESKDPSTKVGATIVDTDNRIVSLGRNGYPQGVEDTYDDREEKLRRTIHAEVNAVLFSGRNLKGHTIYVTHPPCAHCTAILVQSKIARIIYKPALPEFQSRWINDMVSAERLLKEAGYECVQHPSKFIEWFKR